MLTAKKSGQYAMASAKAIKGPPRHGHTDKLEQLTFPELVYSCFETLLRVQNLLK